MTHYRPERVDPACTGIGADLQRSSHLVRSIPGTDVDRRLTGTELRSKISGSNDVIGGLRAKSTLLMQVGFSNTVAISRRAYLLNGLGAF